MTIMCTSLTSHLQKQKCCKLLVQMESTLCHGFVLDSLLSHNPDLGTSHHPPPYIIYLVIGGGGYNEMVKIPRTPKWSPKIPKL